MEVRFDKGIYLPGPGLRLDPHGPHPQAVVSHAHSDHVQSHEEVLSTAATAALMRRRGVTRPRFRTLPFGAPTQVGEARVTLFPAGHVLGSAQVLVEWEGTRLLYSGDFKLRPNRTAEPIQIPEADEVIMETTFGRSHYRLPPTAEVEDRIRRFCRQALVDGCCPVLFCYSLGKGQEVLALLEGEAYPIYLQQEHWLTTALYRELGVSLPPHRRFQPGQKLDGVLLCAMGCRKAAWFARLGEVRTAYLSGWAMDRNALYRNRTDAAFPLSDHADYPELLEYVERTGARRIHTIHGFSERFAADLRLRGYWAEPLREPSAQLTLF
ncbi:MAG: MBL fold metallo-hydrolase [Armatimonadetes bacterium]|nr:MBL fold metallo-hydrolase [Armatimonadota bacterium]